MSIILTVFKKEMIDTLRDKRTLISAIIMPIILIPALLYGVTKMSMVLLEKEKAKKIKIALLDPPADFLASLDTSEFELKTGFSMESGRDEILKDSLDCMLAFVNDYDTKILENKTGKVNMWYKSTNLTVKDRLSRYMDKYEEGLLESRLEAMNISEKAVNPIDLNQYDIAPKKEQVGKMVGGFLPYMFIILCFMGCMYPALDLITGEKERGTIETLLTVPVSRFKILMGKVLAISLVGLAAAVTTILGILASIKLLPDIPEEFLTVLTSLISVKFILMLFSMLIPLSVFFAGTLSAMVVSAKSFKEAQSIVTPLSFVIIVPAMMALMPGIELTWTTAAIPILNIALATKEIVAGTIQTGHYVLIVVSLIVLALIAVAISYRQFSKENVVLK